jgi:hypothetical protein
MFDLDSRIVVGRIVYRLLRALNNPDAVEEAVQRILPELTTLSAKLDLITDVGHREGAGHQGAVLRDVDEAVVCVRLC